MREINRAGLDLIKSYEGLVDGDPATVNLDPYVDPIGILTIGWGHAITYGKNFLKDNKADWKIARALYPSGISTSEAEMLLCGDIHAHTMVLDHLVTVPLTENQSAALASLAFNIGAGNFAKSTLLKLLNKGNFKAAAERVC
jgi:lysozyme